ncbi:NAD-dependent protein deacylase [Symmachiella dynata]|nr:NAD-dependent protein deacylase [Symmachiella dynata]
MPHQQTIDTIVRILRKSRSILFVTGAGMSADSGVPTYRGIGGLYEVESTEDGLPIEAILSGTMIRTNPLLTWKYLAAIAAAAEGATINRGHSVIAEMERHFPRVWTLTQNVDGFHRAAGSQNVIEIHGNMRSLSCMGCTYRRNLDETAGLQIPPRCPACDDILRPDVVLFEEALPEDSLRSLQRQLETGFSVVFSIGTSGLFPYIQEPIAAARRRGVPTIEINPDETIISSMVDYQLQLGAADALQQIWQRYSLAN